METTTLETRLKAKGVIDPIFLELDNLACWNWALFGGVRNDQPPYFGPQYLFSYVSEDDTIHDIAVSELKNNKNWKIRPDVLKYLDQVRKDLIAGLKQKGKESAARDVARECVFRACVVQAGMQVSSSKTPYKISMIGDGDKVTFDHWWVEIEDVVSETFPNLNRAVYGKNVFWNSGVDMVKNRTENMKGLKINFHDYPVKNQLHSCYVTALPQAMRTYLEFTLDILG
jgi:hypothetical protein